MKKFVVMTLALLLVVASALCFASCGQKIVEVEKEVVKEVEVPVEVPVEVEKIVEVPVEVEVEKKATEINGIAVVGNYATQTKKGTLTVNVQYIDKTLNTAFDPTKEISDTNPLYVTAGVVVTIPYTVDYTYKTLIFDGATYNPTIPGATELVKIEGFYAKNGTYLYATDAAHTITAEGYVDTTALPTEAVEQLTTAYEYVTFDFAD